MNGVDRANQLRRNFTAHMAYKRRVWRPLWYYILDIYTVNSYLIWKGDTEDKDKKGQRPFRKALTEALLHIPYPSTRPSNYKTMSPINEKAENHEWEAFKKRGYCVWCKEHPEEWIPKRASPAPAEAANKADPKKRQRQSRSNGGCLSCAVHLCKKGGCIERFHGIEYNE